jgi:hypothetical protein
VLLGLMGRSSHFTAAGMRDCDHRFEWTQAEFRQWAGALADTYGQAQRGRLVSSRGSGGVKSSIYQRFNRELKCCRAPKSMSECD